MISSEHKTQPYDTKMRLKFVFNRTAFLKFKISKNFKQNVDETHSKQAIYRKIHTSLWISKVSRKKSVNQSLKTFANFHTLIIYEKSKA